VKRTGRDKHILVVIYIYIYEWSMETTQEISLYSYLYLKLAKMPCFSFYLLWGFLSYRIGEQEGRTDSAGWGGWALVGEGRW
jgi:hypothetical protein